jgi:hypothetical protein
MIVFSIPKYKSAGTFGSNYVNWSILFQIGCQHIGTVLPRCSPDILVTRSVNLATDRLITRVATTWKAIYISSNLKALNTWFILTASKRGANNN